MPLNKILTVYAGTPKLVEALETYIETQMERAAIDARNDIAEQVCEHLHDGPAKMGVLCRSCYEAEKNAPGILEFESLRQINESREQKP